MPAYGRSCNHFKVVYTQITSVCFSDNWRMFAVRTLRATLSIWVEQSIIWAGFNNKLTLWHWHKQSHCELLTFSKILFKSEPCVSVQTSTLIRSACCTHILCIAYVLVYLKVVWRNEARCLWKVKRNVCTQTPNRAPVCWAVWSGLALSWMWFCAGCRFNSVYFRPREKDYDSKDHIHSYSQHRNDPIKN